jgi:hypothetical protein
MSGTRHAIDRVVRKYAGERGLDRGCSAHSMCVFR